jgi:TatD DNase family protein
VAEDLLLWVRSEFNGVAGKQVLWSWSNGVSEYHRLKEKMSFTEPDQYQPIDLIDTHCHLDFDEFTLDRSQILARAKQVGVREIITIGIDLPSSRRAVELAKANWEVHASVGIHPHNAYQLSANDIQELLSIGGGSEVVAYGEIGLDFYRNYQPKSTQISCLREQLEVARQLNLPLVLHDREAHEDVLEVLREHKSWEMGGTMHCFSGDWSFARSCLDLGFCLSIAGPVTFAKSKTLQDVAQNCPLDRLLLETDAPFLAPVPRRGERNEPAFLIHTAEKIASLKKILLGDVARETTLNARELFRLPDPPRSRED